MENISEAEKKRIKRIEKEKKMKEIENEAFLKKSKLIEDYSKEILSKLRNKETNGINKLFLEKMILFLLDEKTDFESLNIELSKKNNPENIYLSTEVISLICNNIQLLNFGEASDHRMLEKIVIYNRYLYNDIESYETGKTSSNDEKTLVKKIVT